MGDLGPALGTGNETCLKHSTGKRRKRNLHAAFLVANEPN